MPHQRVPPHKRKLARAMRHVPTEAEDRLWWELRDRKLDGIKFRRQQNLQPYIVDFVCFEAKLIVELDGTQHAESAYDAVRDAELKRQGFRVLRFWNDDVLRDLNAVCDTIVAYARDGDLQP
jgi:very-short-patch-repair endonuclease